MFEKLLRELREAPSVPLARKVMFDIEDLLTPVKFQGALPLLEALEGPARIAVDGSPVVRMLQREAAEPYVQDHVAQGVDLYRGRGSAIGRALVVVLSGRHSRPMLATPIFLQHLPAQLFDVLLLFDATNSHYVDGIAGYADSLLTLTQKVHAEFGTAGYQRVYHYGVSSGGFPALRMGLMAEAHRSIAIGGLFQWPIDRLLRGEAVASFDPICDCNAGRRRRLVSVHADLERDIKHARRASRIVRVRDVNVPGINEHNMLFPLLTRGHLRDFNQRLFGYKVRRDGSAKFVDGFGV